MISPGRGKNKKCLKPPPRQVQSLRTYIMGRNFVTDLLRMPWGRHHPGFERCNGDGLAGKERKTLNSFVANHKAEVGLLTIGMSQIPPFSIIYQAEFLSERVLLFESHFFLSSKVESQPPKCDMEIIYKCRYGVTKSIGKQMQHMIMKYYESIILCCILY